MPKKAKELTALEVSRLSAQGKHNTGLGLYLEIKGGSKSWILRIVTGAKRRSIGLGSYPMVTLAKAREKAIKAREMIGQGIDPVEHKKSLRSALLASQAKEITFKQCAIAYIDSHAHEWKSKRTLIDWPNSLKIYAYPVIGGMLVRDVEQVHILKILNPIWTQKTETAQRVRRRIEAVLDYAAVSGYRSENNPAKWKGRLDKLLPAPTKIKTTQHHKAISVNALPSFIADLSGRGGMAAQCLLFTILTACRSGEARGATWSEIDLEANVWTIPAERMKAGAAHQVPLSDEAVGLLRSIHRVMGCDYVFPSAKGKQLSDMSLSMLMRRMGEEAVPHGFRSTFRDWAGDCTNYPREIAEAALAHTLGSKVEAAYRRSTALEKRRSLMSEWGEYVFSGMPMGSTTKTPKTPLKFKKVNF